MIQRDLLTRLQDHASGAGELFCLFPVEELSGSHVIGNAVPRVYRSGAGACLFDPHVEAAVADEKRIMDIPLRKFIHLFCAGGISGSVDRNAVREGDHPSDTDVDIMVFIVSCLNGFHNGVSEIEEFVFTVYEGVCIADHFAVIAALFDQFHLIVVLMSVGDEDQVRGEIIAFSCVRIDVDDLFVGGHDAETAVSLIQKMVRRSDSGAFLFRSLCESEKERECQKEQEIQFFHGRPPFKDNRCCFYCTGSGNRCQLRKEHMV